METKNIIRKKKALEIIMISRGIAVITAMSIILVTCLSGCGLSENSIPSPSADIAPTPTDIVLLLPDLVITKVSVDYNTNAGCPSSDSNLQTLVQIKNQGTADAGPFVVEANSQRQALVAGLVAGQSIILGFSGYQPQTEVLLDVTFQVPEIDEKNNRTYRELVAPTLSPGCLPTSTPEIPMLQPQIILKGHTAPVWSIDFSPDGSLVASGSVDDTLRLWNVKERSLLRTMTGHAFPIVSLRFSPNGVLLATGATDGIIRLWRVGDGNLLQTFQGHAGWINDLDFSPDGRYLVSSAQDFTVRVWNVSDGISLQTIDEGMSSINSIRFSPDGLALAWAENSGTVRVRTLASQWVYIFKESNYDATCIAYTPDGNRLVAGYADGSLRLWRLSDGELLQFIKTYDQTVTAVAFSPDSKWLVTASGSNLLKLWRLNEDSYQQIPAFILRGQYGPLNRVIFSPKGNWIAAATDGNNILVWEVPTGN